MASLMEKPEDKSGHSQQSLPISDASEDEFENWKAGRQQLMILGCLAIVSLVVALDGTVLVPVLPVSDNCLIIPESITNMKL
jgi:hypothetical protein